jgi:hypothetical protein
MNYDQLMGMLRVVVPVGLGFVTSKGWIPAGAAGDVGTAVLGVGAAVWSYYAHTDSAKIKAVESLPDVAKIIVKATAQNGVADAAADRTRPKVVTQGSTQGLTP